MENFLECCFSFQHSACSGHEEASRKGENTGTSHHGGLGAAASQCKFALKLKPDPNQMHPFAQSGFILAPVSALLGSLFV